MRTERPNIDESRREDTERQLSQAKREVAIVNATIIAAREAGRDHLTVSDWRIAKMQMALSENIKPVGEQVEDYAPQTHRDRGMPPAVAELERIQQAGLSAVAHAVEAAG